MGTILIADDHPQFRQALVPAVTPVHPAERPDSPGAVDGEVVARPGAVDERVDADPARMDAGQRRRVQLCSIIRPADVSRRVDIDALAATAVREAGRLDLWGTGPASS
jgi:hypothetical protein